MSDWPIEQRQIDALLEGMTGRILIGSLGLGYAAAVLAANPKVKKVTVIEIAPEIIQLVYPHLANREKIEVIQADLLEWLKTNQEKGSKKRAFDSAFYDIWASDGESTFHSTVVPLHALSVHCVKDRPRCWNEDIMRGQLHQGLLTRLGFLSHPEVFPSMKRMKPLWEEDGTEEPWHNWCAPYFRWWKDNNPSEDEALRLASTYAGIYGIAGWKRLWSMVTG